jgi:hypothetical protein
MLNIFNGLTSNFESIDLKNVITQLIPQLKAYLENSGIFFEKSIENLMLKSFGNSESGAPKQLANLPDVKHILDRDLKANLMTMKFLMEDKETLQKIFGPKSMATLNSSINNLLDHITHQQGRAAGQLDSGEPFQIFSYVLPLKGDEQTARLKVYYQKKRSGADKGFRISLLLSQDRLGDLRTDFYLLDNDLNITFFVEEESVKAKIQENFPELQKLLHGFFNQTLLKVIVSEKKVADFDHEDRQVSGDSKVDLRI